MREPGNGDEEMEIEMREEKEMRRTGIRVWKMESGYHLQYDKRRKCSHGEITTLKNTQTGTSTDQQQE